MSALPSGKTAIRPVTARSVPTTGATNGPWDSQPKTTLCPSTLTKTSWGFQAASSATKPRRRATARAASVDFNPATWPCGGCGW